jgi:hypothetical protein
MKVSIFSFRVTLAIILAFVWLCSKSASAETDTLTLVQNIGELKEAIKRANKSESPSIIELADGEYKVTGTALQIRQNNITIRSASGRRNQVVLMGSGLKDGVGSIFDVGASNFSIIGVTMQQTKWHLIQLRAESNADNFYMDNCVLQDSGQQLFKVSHKKNEHYSDNGVIKNSLFQYTSGLGPSFYIGGIDAHRAVKWTVENNTFIDISSPSKRIAEHAIHFWNDSRDVHTIGNIIINSDRGIGYGLNNRDKQSRGGLIANNVIIHTKPDNPFTDVAIVLESSPDTAILNNRIFMTTNYPNAIEYRFERTKNVLIQGNVTNKAISGRNGGEAEVIDNETGSTPRKLIDSVNYLISK